MFKTSLLSLPLIAALLTAAAPVLAADYHIVVPAPGKAAPYAAIQVELNPASLPVGRVGMPYVEFDFNTALRITGDTALDMSQVTWSAYSGALPQGLTLTKEGSVVGVPAEAGTSSFQALAKYKTKTAVGTYAVEVQVEKYLINREGVRSWEDGTFASSCQAYIHPAPTYHYEGATGDGIYRIAPNGQAPFDAYCDMTSDGGGWTRVVRQTEAQPVENWNGGANGESYTLSSAQIPSHTQTAFGKDEQATFVDYVDYVYTTDNIHPAVTVTSPKTGKVYQVHRHADYYHGNYDPEYSLYTTPLDWTNALTIDAVGLLGRNWAFVPTMTTVNYRGYSFNGTASYLYSDTFAWTVWVR